MIEFGSHSGLEKEPRYIFNQFSLGNMGGTSVECVHKPIKETSFTLKCYYGNVQPTKADFGILSTTLDKQNYCTNKAIWEGDNSKKTKADCTSLMDKTYIQDQLDKCAHKPNCTIAFDYSSGKGIIPTSASDSQSSLQKAQCTEYSSFFL